MDYGGKDVDDILLRTMDTDHTMPDIPIDPFDCDKDIMQSFPPSSTTFYPIEIDDRIVVEEDNSFMLDCFNSDEERYAFSSIDRKASRKELTRKKPKKAMKIKKRLSSSGRNRKRKRKSSSRLRRCHSSPAGLLYAEQTSEKEHEIFRSCSFSNLPENPSSIAPATQLSQLSQLSFNQVYQNRLSNLATSMKRSALSRTRVMQFGIFNFDVYGS